MNNEKITIIEIVLWVVMMFCVTANLAGVPVKCMVERALNDRSFSCVMR